MIWLLGIIDLLCALSLLLVIIGYPVFPLQAGGAMLLFIKGAFFFGDVLSVMDMLVAVLMFALLWVQQPTLAIAAAIFLALKGFYSFA
jgi:hypothetical protein